LPGTKRYYYFVCTEQDFYKRSTGGNKSLNEPKVEAGWAYFLWTNN